MAGRSRRGSTLASSMATASLTRQREELHEQQLADAPRYPTGKRKATRTAAAPKEKQPTKPRGPRCWVPPGWDKVPWTARSVHPAGLETHHEPNMSAFFSSADQPPSGLSWLKPRNQVSIWEHMAEAQRRQDVNETQAAAPCPGIGSVPVLASSETKTKEKKVVASGTAATVVMNDRAWSASVPTPVELPCATETTAAESTVLAEQDDRGDAGTGSPTLLRCGVTASSANVDLTHSLAALKTPADTCPADRVSIMSLVE